MKEFQRELELAWKSDSQITKDEEVFKWFNNIIYCKVFNFDSGKKGKFNYILKTSEGEECEDGFDNFFDAAQDLTNKLIERCSFNLGYQKDSKEFKDSLKSILPTFKMNLFKSFINNPYER